MPLYSEGAKNRRIGPDPVNLSDAAVMITMAAFLYAFKYIGISDPGKEELCPESFWKHCRMYWKDEGFQCVHAGLLVDPIEVNDTETRKMIENINTIKFVFLERLAKFIYL